MEPLTEPEIRASFANCSKGEAGRIKVPDLAAVPWGDLDFLGWADPGRRLVFAYLTNRLQGGLEGSPHMSELSDAVLAACD